MLLWFGTESLRLEEVSGCARLSPAPAEPRIVLIVCIVERTPQPRPNPLMGLGKKEMISFPATPLLPSFLILIKMIP